MDTGGVPGGLGTESLDALTEIAVKWTPDRIDIEKNYGNGALSAVWTPRLLRRHTCGIEDVWESGQKELRIIDVLEPVIGSNRLVVDIGLLDKDWQECAKYPVELRPSYSVFFQLSRITRDKGALIHDDRLDALAGSVRSWSDHLKQDEFKARARAAQSRYTDLMKNPLGNGRPVPGFQSHIKGPRALNALSCMRRRV